VIIGSAIVKKVHGNSDGELKDFLIKLREAIK